MSGADLPPDAFAKQDTGDDLAFYAPPRLVMHIDELAVAALTGFYRDVLPDGGRVLDLMSSWVSHLPPDQTYGEVVGHGMNAEELAANPRLDRWFVADLNADPVLPLADDAFDAALCCVGVRSRCSPRCGVCWRRARRWSSAMPTGAFRRRPARSGARSTCATSPR